MKAFRGVQEKEATRCGCCIEICVVGVQETGRLPSCCGSGAPEGNHCLSEDRTPIAETAAGHLLTAKSRSVFITFRPVIIIIIISCNNNNNNNYYYYSHSLSEF
jgi:hypothetical protein